MPRPLLILDIDETLLHAREEPLGRECDFQLYDYHVYLRPHVRLFLESASERYDLACWSSATRNYVAAMVKELMVGLTAEPLFIWDRSRCTRRFDFVHQEEYFLKDLKKVRRRGFDLDRVLILEDEPRKVNRNFGNAIYVKPFEGDLDDDELLRLAQYLLSIDSVDNFRHLEKRSWRSQV
jgi:RNA polymerase II subunit A small phosphatase-like protein